MGDYLFRECAYLIYFYKKLYIFFLYIKLYIFVGAVQSGKKDKRTNDKRTYRSTLTAPSFRIFDLAVEPALAWKNSNKFDFSLAYSQP